MATVEDTAQRCGAGCSRAPALMFARNARAHICLSRNDGSFVSDVPTMRLKRRHFTAHQYASMWFIHTPVVWSLKLRLWLTVWCVYPSIGSCQYAAHSLDQMVVPSRMTRWMIGRSVLASCCSTSWMKPSFTSGS